VRQGEGVSAHVSYKVRSRAVGVEGYERQRAEVIRRFRDFTALAAGERWVCLGVVSLVGL
jgi:hypothetical protein